MYVYLNKKTNNICTKLALFIFNTRTILTKPRLIWCSFNFTHLKWNHYFTLVSITFTNTQNAVFVLKKFIWQNSFFLRKCRGPYHKITKAYLSFLYHTGINFSSTIGHGRCRPGRLYLCKMLLLLFYMHTLLRKVKLPQDYTHHYDYCSLPSKNSLCMLLSANTILHTSNVFKFSL